MIQTSLAVWCVLLSFSMGTAAIEVSMVILALVSVWRCRRIPQIPNGLLLYAVVAIAAIRVPSDVVEGLGKWWLFCPLIFLPPLLKSLPQLERTRMLVGASVAMSGLALVGCWQVFQGEVAHGWYSHHLSFGYLLLVPFAYCLSQRHWVLAVLLALGVLSTKAQGPLYSLLVLLSSIWLSPKQMMVGGSFGVFVLFVLLSDSPYFQERLAIWGTALELLQIYPMGTGVTEFRELYAAVQASHEPPFFFPHHAHDSAIQQALWFGIPIWVAWAMLLRSWWSWSNWGKMALVSILLGSFTEDTLGDMEVLRILLVFGCFAAVEKHKPSESHPTDHQN